MALAEKALKVRSCFVGEGVSLTEGREQLQHFWLNSIELSALFVEKKNILDWFCLLKSSWGEGSHKSIAKYRFCTNLRTAVLSQKEKGFDRNRKWKIFAFQTNLVERYAVAWLCRARLRPGAAACLGWLCPCAMPQHKAKCFSRTFLPFPHIFSKYEEKE